MEAAVKPEPAADEREAMLRALDSTNDRPQSSGESAWRRASLREAVEESEP